MKPLIRLSSLLPMSRWLVDVFEGVLLMRITIVACVMEQNNNFGELSENGACILRTVFDRYKLINPTTRPHDPCDTLHINNEQRNTESDAYGAPSQNDDLPGRNQLLHV